MKRNLFLALLATGVTGFAAQAAEPLRPLDPDALKVLGIAAEAVPPKPMGSESRDEDRLVPMTPQAFLPTSSEATPGPASQPDPERTASLASVSSEPAPLAPMPELDSAGEEKGVFVPAQALAVAVQPQIADVPLVGANVPAADEGENLHDAGEVPAAKPVASVQSSALELAPVEDTPPASSGPTWVASNGATLRETISRWANKAGWVLSWDDERPDLEVVGTVNTNGSFIDAVTYLFDVYHRSGVTYDVTLFAEQKLVLVRNTQ